jgi:S-(hydroxymethyl)glutathione dehydrogenase/alcohol dehydrogenase
MKMMAAVLHDVGAPLMVEEVELGGPGPHEVLVRVAACGVCHSDLHMLKGEWAGYEPPIVVGHEGAGVVEQVGAGVGAVKPGDHVVLGWKTSCRECRFCTSARPYLCERPPQLDTGSAITKDGLPINRHLTNGYFAEYAVVPKSTAVPIGGEIDLDRAALLACAVMTGVGAAVNTAHVRPGSSVVVFGCGGVGINVIQGAALCGAARIIGVDVAEAALEFARQFGLTDTVNAAQTDPVAAVKAMTDGRGVDYAFEAVGSVRTVEQAFSALDKGGQAVVAGIPAFREAARPALPVMDFFGDRSLTASYYGGANLWRDIPRLVDLYLRGKLELDGLITRRYHLAEINQAFADLAAATPGRGVVVF